MHQDARERRLRQSAMARRPVTIAPGYATVTGVRLLAAIR